MLENVRLSFPNLHKKTAFNENSTPKYAGTFILDKNHPQVPELKAMMRTAINEKWDERPDGLILALRDGKTKKSMDGFGDGVVFFNASSEKRPTVFDRDRTPLTENDGRPYAGCYVNALVSVWAQDNKYGKRINFELNGVQFYKDGDAFGGGGAPAAADDFPDLEEPSAESYHEQADEGDDDLLG